MCKLKELLQQLIELIDNDEFIEIDDDIIEQLSNLIHRPATMGREDAARFLGISLNRFYELRDAGIIPEPRKRKGFKEKEYFITDLRKCLKFLQENK